MEFRTNWKFDGFYPGAARMRKKIDDHFDESIARHLPFERRAVWNYWYIPTLYAYFRTHPAQFFESLFDDFMAHLDRFAAREFGLRVNSQPFLSMYINGCVQNIHNDATNGRLAYVYSLTNWETRHFIGGETFVYHVGDAQYERIFTPTGGWGFYDFIEPHFNRLGLFDDRLPHAVNAVQGTMNPLDARFALHGHIEELDEIAYVAGGLASANLQPMFDDLRGAAAHVFGQADSHGFVTYELAVAPDGAATPTLKHMQLLKRHASAADPMRGVDRLTDALRQVRWPAASEPSTLVFALGAGKLH